MTLEDRSSTPQVAIIVVNYGTAELAIRAVESVLCHETQGCGTEIHLLDNASPEEDAARFEEAKAAGNWGDRVTLWPEQANHGFGRGNNVVLRALNDRPSPPDYVFLLNPDARIENAAVTLLAEFMDRTPAAGAVGARLLDGDGQPTTGAFRFPNILGEFEKASNFGPISSLLKDYRVPLEPDQESGPVDWVSGAATMFRFSALKEVGFFDPGYFLYYEEVDLMRRLKSVGWEVHYWPKAEVLHLEGASTQIVRQNRRPDYLYRSWRRYFQKQGRLKAIAASLALNAGSLVGLLVARLYSRPPQVPRQFFRDHWHYVLAPLLGLRRDQAYDEASQLPKPAP